MTSCSFFTPDRDHASIRQFSAKLRSTFRTNPETPQVDPPRSRDRTKKCHRQPKFRVMYDVTGSHLELYAVITGSCYRASENTPVKRAVCALNSTSKLTCHSSGQSLPAVGLGLLRIVQEAAQGVKKGTSRRNGPGAVNGIGRQNYVHDFAMMGPGFRFRMEFPPDSGRAC